MRLKKKEKLVTSILSLLLVAAPIFATQWSCITFWGEPDIPESLRK